MFLPQLFYEAGRQRTQPFKAVFDTTKTSAGSTASNQLQIPIITNQFKPFTIDWGDGNVDSITTWNSALLTHTYATAGVYTTKIKGVTFAIMFNNTKDRLKLLEIKTWGRIVFVNNAFNGCANLVLNSVSDTPVLSSANVIGLFQGCSSLTTINNLNYWETSAITNMSNMFFACSNFNQSVSFDTSNVTNFLSMFQGCNKFNQAINFNFSKATTLQLFLGACTVFNQPINWDLPLCVNLNGLFTNCTAFNSSITLTNINIVANFSSLFSGCANFNQSINFNSSAGTTFNSMFLGCAKLNSSITLNTSSATDLREMFNNCTIFNQPLSFSTANVITMQSMFRNALAFNQNISSWVFNKNVNLITFMDLKSSANYNTTYYDALLINWETAFIGTGRSTAKTLGMGSIKRTATGTTPRANLVTDGWAITDGGI